MSKQTSKWLSTNIPISRGSGSLWSDTFCFILIFHAVRIHSEEAKKRREKREREADVMLLLLANGP